MNRRDLTERNSRFNILLIEQYGEHPVDDYLLRSTPEQQRLYKAKVTKCDGIIKISAHQRAEAIDKYLTVIGRDGKVTILFQWPEAKAKLYHSIWEKKFGGKPMISWDRGHFE